MLSNIATLGLANSPELQDGQQRFHLAVYARLFLHITARQQPARPLPILVRIAPDHRHPGPPSTTRRCSSGPLHFLEHGANIRPLRCDKARCQTLGYHCASTADPWDESAQFNQEALRALQDRTTEKGQERKWVPICHMQRESQAQTTSRGIGDCGMDLASKHMALRPGQGGGQTGRVEICVRATVAATRGRGSGAQCN